MCHIFCVVASVAFFLPGVTIKVSLEVQQISSLTLTFSPLILVDFCLVVFWYHVVCHRIILYGCVCVCVCVCALTHLHAELRVHFFSNYGRNWKVKWLLWSVWVSAEQSHRCAISVHVSCCTVEKFTVTQKYECVIGWYEFKCSLNCTHSYHLNPPLYNMLPVY